MLIGKSYVFASIAYNKILKGKRYFKKNFALMFIITTIIRYVYVNIKPSITLYTF